jgi:hypothetical protein
MGQAAVVAGAACRFLVRAWRSAGRLDDAHPLAGLHFHGIGGHHALAGLQAASTSRQAPRMMPGSITRRSRRSSPLITMTKYSLDVSATEPAGTASTLRAGRPAAGRGPESRGAPPSSSASGSSTSTVIRRLAVSAAGKTRRIRPGTGLSSADRIHPHQHGIPHLRAGPHPAPRYPGAPPGGTDRRSRTAVHGAQWPRRARHGAPPPCRRWSTHGAEIDPGLPQLDLAAGNGQFGAGRLEGGGIDVVALLELLHALEIGALLLPSRPGRGPARRAARAHRCAPGPGRLDRVALFDQHLGQHALGARGQTHGTQGLDGTGHLARYATDRAPPPHNPAPAGRAHARHREQAVATRTHCRRPTAKGPGKWQ